MFYRIVAAILKVLFFPFFRVKVYGKENIPDKNNLIVCANHRSNLDPIFLAMYMPIGLNFMAKKELFEVPILKRILGWAGAFPVDRKGSDLKALRHAVGIVKEEKVLGIFPEGTRVKDIKRSNMHEGVGFIALKSKADILPVEIISSYKIFSRVDIYIKEPLDTSAYQGLKNKEAMKKISDDIFKNIYEKRNLLERERNGNNRS